MVSLLNLLGTLILISLVGTAFAINILDLSTQYNTNVTDDVQEIISGYNESFNELTVMGTDMENATRGTAASQTTTSGFSFEGTVASLKIMLNSFGITSNLLASIETTLNIPSIFRIGLLSVLTMVLIIAIMASVLGRRIVS